MNNTEEIVSAKLKTEIDIIAIPDTHEIQSRSLTILQNARQIIVCNREDNEAAAMFLRGIKTLASEIIEKFAPAKQAAHNAHKQICTLENDHIKPLKDAESIVKKVMTAWMVAEDHRRIREQEKLNAKAEKKGEIATVIESKLSPDGVSLAETWGAEVVDFMAVVKAVAAGRIPSTYLLINQTLIDQQARALKNELKIPGIKVWNAKRMSAQRLR